MMRQLVLTGPLLLAVGCSCQQEYSFPEPVEITHADPKDHGSWLSMDAAPDGRRITMAYYDRSAGALGYAVGTPGADGAVDWLHERVDGYPGSDGLNRANRGKFASQKTAPDGTVWVAYTDVEKGGLYVARRTAPSTWESEEIDPGAGHWASLAIGADGNPIVAHHHPGDKSLRLSRFDGQSWSSSTIHTGQPWSYQDPETNQVHTRPASVGTYARLFVHDGVEYIAFYDAAQRTLDLLEGANGDYTHTVVDRTGHVGQWPSIVVDGGTLLIAYHDVGAQHLKLATRTGGSWSVETVDDGQFRGADTEVFLRGSKPAVVYFDGYMNDMLLATRDGGDWVVERVGGDDAAVGFHNEVVRLGDTYWMASYDFTNGKLFVASTN